MLSGAVPHILHVESLLWLMCVLWMAHNQVGKSRCFNLNIPTTVCDGHDYHLVSQQKHCSMLSNSSSPLAVTNLPCHFWVPKSPFSPNSRSFVRWLLSFSQGITSPSSVTQAGSGYWSFSCRPYSPACFTAFFVSDWCPTLSARFSKSHINFIIGSLFWNNLTAALTSVSLCSLSIEHKPLPPLSHDRYSSDVEPQGCLHPFPTMILQASLSISLSSVIG